MVAHVDVTRGREVGEICGLGFVGPDEESTRVVGPARSRVQLIPPGGRHTARATDRRAGLYPYVEPDVAGRRVFSDEQREILASTGSVECR